MMQKDNNMSFCSHMSTLLVTSFVWREEALSGKAAVIQVQKALDDSLAVLEKATTEAQ